MAIKHSHIMILYTQVSLVKLKTSSYILLNYFFENPYLSKITVSICQFLNYKIDVQNLVIKILRKKYVRKNKFINKKSITQSFILQTKSPKQTVYNIDARGVQPD